MRALAASGAERTEDLPMLDVYLPMMKAAAIVAAGELGLFEALSDGPLDIAGLAEALGADPGGVARLADFLASVGYLDRLGTRLANTANTSRWFTRRGVVDYTPGLKWTADAWELMRGLADSVRSGAPERTLWEKMCEQPALGASFSRYMHSFARHLAPDLLDHIRLAPGPKRLLDLGGSHGLHAISFCQLYPELEAVIVDQESALTDTAALIAQKGLSGRIGLRPGDLRDLDWGMGYDLAFYLAVAHNQTGEENRKVIRHLARCLRPGGTLVIHEYLSESPPQMFDAAFRLTLLVETGTRTFGQDEIADWLAEGGFAAPVRLDLNPRDKGSLLIAKRLG